MTLRSLVEKQKAAAAASRESLEQFAAHASGKAAGVGAAERALPAAVGGPSPRTVIRGESMLAKGSGGRCITDYLRFTFLPSTMKQGAIRFHDGVGDPAYYAIESLKRYFRCFFPAYLPLNFKPSDKGMFGYRNSVDVLAWVNGEFVRLAIIATGGETAGGTIMVDMSGLGCSMVDDWSAVYSMLQDLDARITRFDTALDLFEGFSLDQFDDLYFSGEFNAGGRIPQRRYLEGGNFHDKGSAGRTLYLGKKQNGKELCIYEKGKQLGKVDSEWLRIELRYGNRDRVIPHDCVLDPTKYFAGGFVALQQLVDSIAEKIKTEQKDYKLEERIIVLKRLTDSLITAYGKTIFQLAQELNMDHQALYDLLSVEGIPRRLVKSTVAGGMKQAHEPA